MTADQLSKSLHFDENLSFYTLQGDQYKHKTSS